MNWLRESYGAACMPVSMRMASQGTPRRSSRKNATELVDDERRREPLVAAARVAHRVSAG